VGLRKSGFSVSPRFNSGPAVLGMKQEIKGKRSANTPARQPAPLPRPPPDVPRSPDPDAISRLRRVLSDPEVELWHANHAEGSPLTADTYARRLDRFCEEFDTTPWALAKMKTKGAYALLIQAVKYYRQNGRAGSTIDGYLKPIRSWFLHNEIVIKRKVRVEGANQSSTLQDERAPEPNELASVWRFCDEREATAISIMAFAGVRPRVLGNYKGTDALQIRDLGRGPTLGADPYENEAEIIIDNTAKTVTIKRTPLRIVVRLTLSKVGHQYESFLCEEGCRRLAAYLIKRMRNGESLAPTSPLIAGDFGAIVTTKTICHMIKKALKHAGFPWRPYILRRYFSTRMDLAASKAENGLRDGWIKFWFGHKGDIESLYRVNKGLNKSQLEAMREAYRRAEADLCTINLNPQRGNQTQRELRASALVAVGYTDEEIKNLNLDKLTGDELGELVRKKLKLTPTEQTPAKPRQLILKVEEAKPYVNNENEQERWRVLHALPTGDVVIESPR
jgi:hypothetical protein